MIWAGYHSLPHTNANSHVGTEQSCLSQGLDRMGCQRHITGCRMGLLLLSKNHPKQLELSALPSRDSDQKLGPDILLS